MTGGGEGSRKGEAREGRKEIRGSLGAGEKSCEGIN